LVLNEARPANDAEHMQLSSGGDPSMPSESVQQLAAFSAICMG
jgi:hypothetical protein